MNENLAIRALEKRNAVIKDSHLVYASGKHGSVYVNKDAVYPYTEDTSFLCNIIANHFAQLAEDSGIDVVIAPAIGGVILSQWVAHHLTGITGKETFGVYADNETVAVCKNETDKPFPVTITLHMYEKDEQSSFFLQPGEGLYRDTGKFVIKRGYDQLIVGKRVLVVEDILTTGGSVRKTVEAVRAAGGEVVAVAALCNRGGVTAKDIGNVPELFSLINITLETYEADTCPLCLQGISINTNVGKGKEFLARQGK